MSSYDPYRPQTQVGPHRVFVDPPPDPASEVPGHPDELQTWLREPGGDLAERARRVDLAEVVEMGRPGRMRDIVMDAVHWNRAVITDEVDDSDDSWMSFEKIDSGPPPDDPGTPEPVPDGVSVPDVLDGVEIPPGATATLGADGTVVIDDAIVGADGDGTVVDEATPAGDEKPDVEYQAGDVPANAKDVVAWIQGAPNEGDAAERSQAAWLVEISRSSGVRTTVKAEIDKHLA